MTPDTGAPENHLSLGEDIGSRSECPGQLREFCSWGFFFFFPKMRKLRQRAESGLDQDPQGVSHGTSHQGRRHGKGIVFPLTAKDGYL